MTSRDRTLVVALVTGTFLLLAATLLTNWTLRGWNTRTGDEPNYLVIDRAFAEDQTVDIARASEREFVDPEAFTNVQPFVAADEVNTHGRFGPGGRLYSAHGYGLPVLLLPGWLVGDAHGAKLTMVALAGVAVAISAWAATRLISDPRVAWLAAGSAAVAAPLVHAAGQVYPDLVVGTALVAVFAVVWLRPERRPLVVDASLAGALAVLPWVHTKAFPSVLLALVALCWSLVEVGSWRRAVVIGVVVVAGVASVFAWNLWIFGRPLGLYSSGEVIPKGSMPPIVLLGLHFDRAHGLFVQNPLLLIGAAEVLIRLRWRQPFTVLFLVVYASLVVPNATHVNWYGGFSMVGRFGWAGAVLLVLPTVLGLARLWRNRPRIAVAVMAAGAAAQAATYLHLSLVQVQIFNQMRPEPGAVQVPLAEYHGWWGRASRVLPAYYDPTWAYHYWPNWAWFVAVVAVMAVAVVRSRRPQLTSQ